MRHKDGHKKHLCCFCKEMCWKLPRHFEKSHKTEEEVKEALSYPVGGKKRREIWKMLTRRGDFDATIQSLREGTDIIYTVRTGQKSDAKEFLPCEFCKGFFAPGKVKIHENTCFLKNSSIKATTAGSRLLKETAILDGKHTEIVKKVLVRMKHDDIYQIIKDDEFLLALGAVELNKKERERYHDIAYTLRMIAKVLKEFRKITNDVNMTSKDLVLPKNFDTLTQAIFKLADYKGPRDIKIPHIILKSGYSLKTLCVIMRLHSLKVGCEEGVKNCRAFLEIYETEYITYSNHAKAVYEKRKANIPVELPLEEDIRLMREMCIKKIHELVKNSEKNAISLDHYKELMKFTFVRILTFNARRGGEPSKLTTTDWEKVESDIWKKKKDIENLEDPLEKMLAKRLKICYVEGKKKSQGSKATALVPMLFTEEVVNAVRILINQRSILGVTEENEYIFTSGTCLNRLRGWDTLQAIAKKLNAKKPPTRTRKYLATALQLLDLNDGELTWVTNHMGHTKDVHFAWYRKEDSTIELTKMAKVLHALDDSESLKNKKIDELCQPKTSGNNSKELPKRIAATIDEPFVSEEECIEEEMVKPPLNKKSKIDDGESSHEEDEDEVPTKKAKSWSQWSQAETKAIEIGFKSFVIQKVNPTMHDVYRIMAKYPILKDRGNKKVRDKVVNTIRKLKK